MAVTLLPGISWPTLQLHFKRLIRYHLQSNRKRLQYSPLMFVSFTKFHDAIDFYHMVFLVNWSSLKSPQSWYNVFCMYMVSAHGRYSSLLLYTFLDMVVVIQFIRNLYGEYQCQNYYTKIFLWKMLPAYYWGLLSIQKNLGKHCYTMRVLCPWGLQLARYLPVHSVLDRH